MSDNSKAKAFVLGVILASLTRLLGDYAMGSISYSTIKSSHPIVIENEVYRCHVESKK